ncbi:MAG: hypothetical protein IV100_29600 [Myxococcales bacterium]|nr:hypothetical protein [Myxococcales bacterium]
MASLPKEGGPICLGLEPDECGAGALCQFAIESQVCPTGEIPEAAGECVEIPASCPEASADAAVCGCDGTTWPSLCHAHAAGVAAMRASPCD